MNLDILEHAKITVTKKMVTALSNMEQRGAWMETSQQLEFALDGRESDSNPSFLVWSPQPRDIRKTTSIVSSRLGRQLPQKDHFFQVLRIAFSQLDPLRQIVLSAEGTTTHRYVCRCAQLFGVDVASVTIAQKQQSFENWLEQLAHFAVKPKLDHQYFVSPPLSKKERVSPLQDEITIRNADQLLAIHLRPKGNLVSLLKSRLEKAQATVEPARTFLALGGPELVPQEVAGPLMHAGAIGWFVKENSAHQTCASLLRDAKSAPHSPPPIIPIDEFLTTSPFLVHCTRSANGPWPDQTENDFLDELLLGKPSRDHSALAALLRILSQQCILGTSAAIRNAERVVSMTSVCLQDLWQLRRFRPHRGRWDFEPYGLAIDQSYLERQGVRPVIYGSESTWNELSIDDRAFFQKVGVDQNSIDWRIEQEYRLCGDLRLGDIPRHKAVVFVPSRADAKTVAAVSKWPVVIVSDPKKS